MTQFKQDQYFICICELQLIDVAAFMFNLYAAFSDDASVKCGCCWGGRRLLVPPVLFLRSDSYFCAPVDVQKKSKGCLRPVVLLFPSRGVETWTLRLRVNLFFLSAGLRCSPVFSDADGGMNETRLPVFLCSDVGWDLPLVLGVHFLCSGPDQTQRQTRPPAGLKSFFCSGGELSCCFLLHHSSCPDFHHWTCLHPFLLPLCCFLTLYFLFFFFFL